MSDAEPPVGTIIGVHCCRCDAIWLFDEPIACTCSVRNTARGVRRHVRRYWEIVRQGSLAQFIGVNARCFCGADLGMAEVPDDFTAALMAHMVEAHPELDVGRGDG